jgi:hypothetical protein
MLHAFVLLAMLQEPQCDASSEAEALSLLDQNYHEHVLFMGNDPSDSSRIVVTGNDKGSWSLTVEPKGPNDFVCLVAHGDNGDTL